MPYGFQTLTDNGNVQFDSNSMFSTYCMINKGVFQLADAYFDVVPGFPSYFGTFGGFATDADIIAWRCADTYVACFMESGYVYWQSMPCAAANGQTYKQWTGLPHHTIEWWAFKASRNITPASSGVGVQIFNSDGSLQWDSNYKPLRVYGRWELPASGLSNIGTVGDYTLERPVNLPIFGSNPVLVTSGGAESYNARNLGNGLKGYLDRHGFKVVGNQISVGSYMYGTSANFHQLSTLSVLVGDGTNL